MYAIRSYYENSKAFLQKWNDAGNLIANHTYNHLDYNDSIMTCDEYAKEIERCDSLINGYSNYHKILRRITSYNVCYTKLLRLYNSIYLLCCHHQTKMRHMVVPG